MLQNAQELQSLIQDCQTQRSKHRLRVEVCAGGGCSASGANDVLSALEDEIAKKDLRASLDLLFTNDGCEGIAAVGTGCHGLCEKGPLVRVHPLNVLYVMVEPKDAPAIIESLLEGRVIEELLYSNSLTKQRVAK